LRALRINPVLPGKLAPAETSGALNLAEPDPPVWHIMSQTMALGPFTPGPLQSF